MGYADKSYKMKVFSKHDNIANNTKHDVEHLGICEIQIDGLYMMSNIWVFVKVRQLGYVHGNVKKHELHVWKEVP